MTHVITLQDNGVTVATYTVPADGTAPVPIPPTPPGPVTPPPGLPQADGPDMWNSPPDNRRNVQLSLSSPLSTGWFNADGVTVIELLVSGANINMMYDGVINGGAAFVPTAGYHTFGAQLTTASDQASGSITVQKN